MLTLAAEYENLLALIADRFRVLVNPETSEPSVEGIYFPGKQFPGPSSAELLDIAILWNSNAAINAVASTDVGMIAGRRDSDCAGLQDGDSRQMAPIILRHFGIAPPDH